MLSREIWVRYQSFENLKQARDTDLRNWLSDAERRECRRYRDEGRFRQWLAGRWLAKRLLSEQLVPGTTDWREIEILSRDERGRAVRPQVCVEGAAQPWCVSISHSARGVLVAVSLNPQIHVGVDLAEKEDLNSQSLVFWFSAKERERLRSGDSRRAAVCWAVKEAVYKAVNAGESFVPRKFEVFPQGSAAYECRHEGESLKDRSRIIVWDVDDHVAVTAVVSPTPEALLDVPRIGGKTETNPASTKQEIVLAGVG